MIDILKNALIIVLFVVGASQQAKASDYGAWQKQIGIHKVKSLFADSRTLNAFNIKCEVGCFTSRQCRADNTVMVYDLGDLELSAYRVTFPRSGCRGEPRLDDYFIAAYNIEVQEVRRDGTLEIVAMLKHYVDGVMQNRSRKELRELPVKGVYYYAAYKFDKSFDLCASADVVRTDKPLLLTQTSQPLAIDYSQCLKRIF